MINRYNVVTISCLLAVAFSCYGSEFTKPRKKCNDAQLREQCCRDMGDCVRTCVHLHKELAEIEEHGLQVVEDMINGVAACPLAQKKGQELAEVATKIAQYNERLAAMEQEVRGYKKMLADLQKAG